jgi:hypothetical protein
MGRPGQSLKDVFEIIVGFDAVQPAVLDQGLQHRAALAGFGRPKEEPVLLSRGEQNRRICGVSKTEIFLAAPPIFTTGIASLAGRKDGWCGQGRLLFCTF